MQKNRKICCRITPGRIVGTVLLAASAVNLIIVGAAFEVSFPEAVPTTTATPSAFAVTTIPPPTATPWNTPTITAEPTDTLTPTWTATSTATSTATPTDTATSTPTFTPSPVPTQCIPRYDWPIYMIRRGDTLSSLSVATGSSVQELMLANCLADSQILAGQPLHVPRLPSSPTPVIIPSDTPVPVENSPTYFKPYGMTCDPQYYVSLSAGVYDREDVISVSATLYTSQGEVIDTIDMGSNGNGYSGQATLDTFTVFDIDHYTFSAMDSLEDVTDSVSIYDRSASCVPVPTDTPLGKLQ
jgi:LysM repeat protein